MHKNRMLRRLAAANLRRNRRMYLPYGIACAIMAAMFFIIINTVFSKSIASMSFGGTTMAVLVFGLVVMTLFTVGYIFYLNSFLIKRRKKELGLYAVLGMEKRHIARMIFDENFMLSGGSLLAGLLAGTLLGRGLFALMLKLMDVARGSTFVLSPAAYLVTAAVFGCIFLLTTFYNRISVARSKPIELLGGAGKAEKQLRGTVPLAIFGLLLLLSAYAAAIFIRSAAVSVGLFWPAVILVIAATYALFTAGSQLVLNAIKKNKKLYYRPKNFISVSGLIYRMKQNAAGLANICILSTMVLVTVSSVCSLYFGQEKILAAQNPSDYELTVYTDGEQVDLQPAADCITDSAAAAGVVVERMYQYTRVSGQLLLSDGALTFANADGEIDYGGLSGANALRRYSVITSADYAAATGRQLTLAAGETAVLSSEQVDTGTININGSDWTLTDWYDDTCFTACKNSQNDDEVFFVVADEAARTQLTAALSPSGDHTPIEVLAADFNGDSEARLALCTGLATGVVKALGEDATLSVDSIDLLRVESYGMYGGLLFMGMFFAVLFLINTILIMYFKQVSEGLEDSERYAILQKVGLSDSEVKATINRQVLIVFFLPLAAAVVHILAASNMLRNIMAVFVMTDAALTYLCIAVTTVVFALIYVLAFRATSKVYYRLVKR